MTLPLTKLPIGIQTFREIIEEGYAYVDKTDHALALASTGKNYFLSRPRRFGKSLFLDTLQELFAGSEPLFRGLYIHDRWDWSRRYPVIRLDFAGGVVQSRAELDEAIHDLLTRNQRRLGLVCEASSLAGCFAELIIRAHEASGQRVVVLVDEYDKPILDNIDHPARAAELREGLKNLYSTLKAQDAHLRFVFLTGVTKFSMVSLFSGLNQLARPHPGPAALPRSAATLRPTWRPPLALISRASIGTNSSAGTTATAFLGSRFTTPSTSCCSSARTANTATTGSRPAAPASSSSCSRRAAPSCPTWRVSRPAKRSSTPSISSASIR
jgi:hypothetical protein